MKKSLRLNKVFFVVLFQSILVSSYIPFSNNHFLCMVELDMLRDQILPVFDFVRSAYVPSDANTAIAVGLSEAVAGAIGGLLSRGTARVVGDQKKDSIGTKVATTSIFFGVRGFTTTTFSLLGMPRPVYYILSALISSCLAEAAKAFGRESDNNIKRLRSEIEVQLDVPEVCGDIVKWLAYDGLFQFYHKSMDMLDQAVMSFSYGAAAAILGFMITYTVTAYTNSREEAEVRIGDETRERKLKKLYLQLSKVGLEGGVMFLTFQTILSLLGNVVPPQLNFKFAFNTFLESVEKENQ